MSPPLVSVSMVTYNHEKYVGEAIQSVLDQTFADIELVVVNDGSTDGTAARIATFTDPRVVAIHQDNGGPSVATNRALAACRGKYVALFSGDDVCHPDRVRRQLEEYARGGRRVLFADCDFIDDDGRPSSSGHFARRAFDLENRTRAQVFARLFHCGNYLNGVTTFTEREVLLGEPYDPVLIQLQDYDVWMRLVKKHDLWVMPDRLLSYRVRGGNGNLSSPSPDKLVRLQNETYLILRRFFDGLPADLFREAFAGGLVNADFTGELEFACERAFAYCRSGLALGRLIGVERLHGLLNDPAGAAVLATRYGYTVRQFFDLLQSVNVAGKYNEEYSTIFLDTGTGWNSAEQVAQQTWAISRDFALTFQLPPHGCLRSIRWDPVELRTCRIRLDAIELRDETGRIRTVDPITIQSNGQQGEDGTVSFVTSDPMFWWPVEGDVASVTVRGFGEFDDTLATIVRQSQNAHELTRMLGETQRLLGHAQGELAGTYASRSWRMTAPLRRATSAVRRLRAG